MKTDGLSKTLLAFIALAVVLIIGQGWNNHISTVQAASGQIWEYKFLNWSYIGDIHSLDHVVLFKEDGNVIPASEDGQVPNVGKKIQQLGSNGWELATNSTYSRHAVFTNGTPANGLTTDEMLIFKRQRH